MGVEKTVSWAATAPNVPAAFAFVMEHLDEFERPSILINPDLVAGCGC